MTLSKEEHAARMELVKRLITNGASTNEIARELGISPQATGRFLKRNKLRTQYMPEPTDDE